MVKKLFPQNTFFSRFFTARAFIIVYYKLDHFIFQRLMALAYKLFLVGVDNVLQSSVPVCYLLAADLEN